ncbi:MAG: DNA-binding protein [Myxococcaceae bacterium]|nr:DNA-binding protein [Myxococcaceae bacterium]
MDNATVAATCERLANLLEAQRANPYRVGAWRAAAAKVRGAVPLAPVAAAEGRSGLERALGVGEGVASALQELLGTGRLRMLERLEGRVSPEDLFLSVPGMGPTLARNAHVRLGIDTLEELEVAANDGSLERVPGFGERRVALVREAVAGMLQHSMRRAFRSAKTAATAEARPPLPPVETLLAVDADYRAKAERGELPLISPVRMNPDHSAWLPVLHAEASGFTFTAMYSNTPRAHRLGRTHDWVVIYFEQGGHESQCTVVTETRGPRIGQRVVRGREAFVTGGSAATAA